MHDSPDPAETSTLVADLEALEQKLIQAQAQVRDLKELAQLEQLPPQQWAELQEQVMALEARMQEYLDDLNPWPALFWQVVRFGGLGLVLGYALGKGLG